MLHELFTVACTWSIHWNEKSLKSCGVLLKCTATSQVFFLVTIADLWLRNLTLKSVVVEPIYCRRHFLHEAIYKLYIYKFRSCHKAIMVTTGRAHCIHNCILRSLFIQFEHSLDWVESLVKGVHYWHIASLTACSLSTLVTPQCNLTMCNRTSCAQVQELP